MAQPKGNLSKWELRKLAEHNITHWKDDDDAKTKMRAAIAAKHKTASGFAQIDAEAEKKEDVKPEVKDEKKAEVAPTPAKVEVLPATQTADVAAPVINVHVPAPGVTIHADEFKFWPAVRGAAGWVQAAIVGAAFYAAFSSRVGELLTLAMR